MVGTVTKDLGKTILTASLKTSKRDWSGLHAPQKGSRATHSILHVLQVLEGK
jgi:hypothetical protein